MKNKAPIFRIPALIITVLVSIGALALVFAAAQPAGATEETVYDCAASGINEQDCRALVDLYESTGGSSWTLSTNWFSGSPCSNGWFGVTCAGTRVQQIVLTNNNLVGTLPASVLNIENLTVLHLGLNQIEGPIPAITNLDSPLFALYLNENKFEGEIPASISNLSALEFLYVNGNRLDGPVPVELCSLRPIAVGGGVFKLTYNALDNDPFASDICIDTADAEWRATQTVAPAPRLQLRAPEGTQDDEPGELTIAWEPIDFKEGGGFYEVFQSTTSGEYLDPAVARTTNKSQSSVTVGGILEGVDYYFVVRTTSYANANNPNVVTSKFSDEITNSPVALTLADFQVAAQAPQAPAIVAALLLILLAAVSAAAMVANRQ